MAASPQSPAAQAPEEEQSPLERFISTMDEDSSEKTKQ